MEHWPLFVLGLIFIVFGIVLIRFPKFGWRFDFGAYKKGDKYKKEDKADVKLSGILFIVIGICFAAAGIFA